MAAVRRQAQAAAARGREHGQAMCQDRLELSLGSVHGHRSVQSGDPHALTWGLACECASRQIWEGRADGAGAGQAQGTQSGPFLWEQEDPVHGHPNRARPDRPAGDAARARKAPGAKAGRRVRWPCPGSDTRAPRCTAS